MDLDSGSAGSGVESTIVAKLGKAKDRVTLLNENVLDVKTEPADIVLAMNFSYWLFKEREQIRTLLSTGVREGLAEDGIFFLDAYGGSEAFKEMRERTKYDDFTYIWDQAASIPSAPTWCARFTSASPTARE